MSRTASKFALVACVSLALPFTFGCSSKKAVADIKDYAQCEAGEFRGDGTGTDEKEALNEARANLAKQIHSSVRVSEKYRKSQNVQNGVETLGSDFVSETLVEANLLNAQDARIAHKSITGGKINVAVCMSKSDAAKGFIERQRFIANSLELASNTALKTEHPKRKNEAWSKTQTLWNELARIQNLLDSWGIEKTAYFDKANEIYSQAREEYKEYCQNMKIHWEDTENECSDAVFANLSKKVNMEKSACSGGFRFRFACEEKCKSLSYGVECSFEPSLAVESCGGERYSLLKASEPATGSDMNSKSKAMENLIGKLPKAVFFEQWEKEIREWVPQCVE